MMESVGSTLVGAASVAKGVAGAGRVSKPKMSPGLKMKPGKLRHRAHKEMKKAIRVAKKNPMRTMESY